MKGLSAHMWASIWPGAAVVLCAAACFTPACGAVAQTVAEGSSSGPEASSVSPLTDEEIQDIWPRLSDCWHVGDTQVHARRYLDRPVMALLAEAIDDETVEVKKRHGAMMWLAVHGDMVGGEARATANRVLRGIVESYYEGGRFAPVIPSRAEKRLHAALLSLAYVADAESLELLRAMLDREWWEEKGGAPGVQAGGAVIPSEHTLDVMRHMALRGVAASGTDEILTMLETGEGLPEDLRKDARSLHWLARERNTGRYYEILEEQRQARIAGKPYQPVERPHRVE